MAVYGITGPARCETHKQEEESRNWNTNKRLQKLAEWTKFLLGKAGFFEFGPSAAFEVSLSESAV